MPEGQTLNLKDKNKLAVILVRRFLMHVICNDLNIVF